MRVQARMLDGGLRNSGLRNVQIDSTHEGLLRDVARIECTNHDHEPSDALRLLCRPERGRVACLLCNSPVADTLVEGTGTWCMHMCGAPMHPTPRCGSGRRLVEAPRSLGLVA